MMLPKAHTLCSLTCSWGEDSSLTNFGTAPVKDHGHDVEWTFWNSWHFGLGAFSTLVFQDLHSHFLLEDSEQHRFFEI